MGQASHRHEAAKIARRFIRQSWRNARAFGDTPRMDPADAMIAARMEALHSSLVVRMVGVWVKALRTGRRWPEEHAMAAVETSHNPAGWNY